jgi:hypothetical protein
MCEKCVELDAKIEHYRQLAAAVNDARALEAIKRVNDQLQAQKEALHPRSE